MRIVDAIDPALRAQAWALPASALEVATAEGPTGFHARLRALLRSARQRITIASLYFGTDPKEGELLDDIDAALTEAPELRVRFLFDHGRGQRRTNNGTTASFVGARFAKHGERATLHLHRMPQVDGIARLLPSPLGELLSVCHFKVLVVDDTAILTGANLSDEYFHCRQARVIVVRHRALCDALDGIVQIAAEHSFRVRHGARWDPPELPARDVGTRVAAHVRAHTPGLSSPTGDVVIVPLFQHPRLGLHDERLLLRRMLALPDGALTLHTPYTNFPPDYLQALRTRLATAAPGTTSVTLASRHSHSFTTGRGLKALVPGFYAEREHHVHRSLRGAETTGPGLAMRHYRREGWVFHQKGVWLVTDDAVATVIGSSSFGARSVARDFDLSFLLATAEPALKDALAAERGVVDAHVEGGGAPQRHWTGPLTSPIVRSFM